MALPSGLLRVNSCFLGDKGGDKPIDLVVGAASTNLGDLERLECCEVFDTSSSSL